ncbi:GNAT family N-acetyltransferase [Streptomyces sp. NPDC004646]
MPWPAAAPLTTPRLRLEPLRVEHAREAFAFLDDARLHTWTGGTPDTLAELEARYARQAAGHSPDGVQGWLNWLLRRRADARLVGTVSALVAYIHPGHAASAAVARALALAPSDAVVDGEVRWVDQG